MALHLRHVAIHGQDKIGFPCALQQQREYCMAAGLRELTHMVEAGQRAVMLFVVQRTDCNIFAACAELDPAYAAGLKAAAASGVEVLAFRCAISPGDVTLADRIPWRDLA